MIADEHFMRLALREAERAAAKNEVPVGAVAVREGKVVARAHNIRETTQDPLGHAEILLLKKLSRKLKQWRLSGITVYVTLEPCRMCREALIEARIKKLVFAAKQNHHPSHRIEVKGGVLAGAAGRRLKKFFSHLRISGKFIPATATRGEP